VLGSVFVLVCFADVLFSPERVRGTTRNSNSSSIAIRIGDAELSRILETVPLALLTNSYVHANLVRVESKQPQTTCNIQKLDVQEDFWLFLDRAKYYGQIHSDATNKDAMDVHRPCNVGGSVRELKCATTRIN
jgi:hypothetical protein